MKEILHRHKVKINKSVATITQNIITEQFMVVRNCVAIYTHKKGRKNIF